MEQSDKKKVHVGGRSTTRPRHFPSPRSFWHLKRNIYQDGSWNQEAHEALERAFALDA